MTTLKLLAVDQSDLTVISAQVQDALTKPTLIEYSPRAQRFTLVVNRFAWDAEGAAKRSKTFERRRSAISIARVQGIRSKGVKQSDDTQVLSLLALRFVAKDAPQGTLELVFADDATIQLDVECIEVQLTDLGGAWESKFKPRHPGA